MKTSELREKTVVALSELLSDLQKELSALKIKRAIDNKAQGAVATHGYKQMRHNIARVKTVLGEKLKSNS